MNFEYMLLVFVSIVSLIGGVNWLFTAINSWSNGNEETPDLLQKNMQLSTEFSNVIYVVVFVCTVFLFLMVIFPNYLKKMFIKVANMTTAVTSKVTGK